MAEALIEFWGRGRFAGFSAGSQPRGEVNPLALETLSALRVPIADARSKDWSEFASADAPEMNFVFTVCDDAAGEQCPVWPGQPITAHWGIADPASVEGTEVEKTLAFRRAFAELERRIKIFVSLPIAAMDRLQLQTRLDAIATGADDAVNESA
jgi:protein-tyrosine-phosphatase